MGILAKRTRLPSALPGPKHLSPEGKKLWSELSQEYGIDDPAGAAILEAGLESSDRMRAAQRSIAKDGATVKDRFGQLQAHPAIRIERDCRSAWLAALKQLNLDIEPLQNRVGRPSGGATGATFQKGR